MKINVQRYRDAHRGRGPGGTREVWSFHAAKDIIRIEGGLEFGTAKRKAVEIAKRRTGVQELEVAP